MTTFPSFLGNFLVNNDESKSQNQNQNVGFNGLDVKLAKFELLIQETSKYLMEYRGYNPKKFSGLIVGFKEEECFSMCCKLPVSSDYSDNKWIEVINRNIFLNPFYSVNTIEDLRNIIQWSNGDSVNIYSNGDLGYSAQCSGFMSSSALIFWALFLCAIDDRFYDNEINMVSDLACALNFTPNMMSDWCAAVKFVLDGNVLSEECSLKVYTEEAKKFFLHRWC